jgi:hypothetical protein
MTDKGLALWPDEDELPKVHDGAAGSAAPVSERTSLRAAFFRLRYRLGRLGLPEVRPRL